MKKILKSVKGATMVEYSLLVGLISIAALTMIVLVGPQLLAIWTDVQGALNTAGF